nr:MAG TPA: hypothetical protein [Caudoviricetes sp.]
MAKAQVRNIWKDNEIPVLEYCAIPRAIDLLGCKIEDIIHFAEIGAVELCLKLEGFKASLTSPLKLRDPNVWENGFASTFSFNKYQVNSPLSLFSPDIDISRVIDPEAKPTYLYENENTPGLKKPYMLLYGLWAIKPIMIPDSYFFNRILSDDGINLTPLDFSLKEVDEQFNFKDIDSDVIYASPKTEHLYPDGCLDQNRLKPIVTLTPKDLYLTRRQIEIIYNGFGDVLPSYINGEVERSDGSENIIKTERLTIHQFSFIYGLLRMLDISDDAISKASPNELNKILSTKAASKGIHFSPPDKNTWARWREKFPTK